jgi:DNA-binding MarR family transcriptional regulator
MAKLAAAALAELLERLARILHSRGFAEGLFPAQWTALRYFDRMPPERCTASDLARFQGLANGPVSRTVRTLVQKGFLAKAEAQPRGRAERLAVTADGRRVLVNDPTRELEAVLGSLPEADRAVTLRTLESLLRRLSPAP